MKLSDPFDPDRVSWRVGSTTSDKTRGMALAYIDARDVMDRLDAVCSPDLWQCRYQKLGEVMVCEIGIKCGDEWVWKADGAGDTDFEGEKGSMSDSFKRAGVKWGIGRYLYEVDAPWVEIEAHGKSYKIVDKEKPRLRRALVGITKSDAAGLQPEPAPVNRKEAKAQDIKAENVEWARSFIETAFQKESVKELREWEANCVTRLELMKKTQPATFDWIENKLESAYRQLEAAAA